MFCKKCGREIGDNDAFCPGCGTKQAATYKEVFVRNGLKEEDFIANINKWFQWHPKAANITCSFGFDTAVGMFVNKYKLNQFVIEYELFEHENDNQYGLVKEDKVALIQKDLKELVGEWQLSHPQVKIVNWQGGTHSRGEAGSFLMNGLGASNRMTAYIFFKFPRNKDQNQLEQTK